MHNNKLKNLSLSIALGLCLSSSLTGCGSEPQEVYQEATKLWKTQVPADQVKALELFNEAAEKGNLDAIHFLALYNFEQGNFDKAADLIVKVKNEYPSDYNYIYGYLLMYGKTFEGVKEDLAVELLKKAADANNPKAYYELASYYMKNGNYYLARQYFKHALENNDERSVLPYAELIITQRSAPSEYERAFKLVSELEKTNDDVTLKFLMARSYVDAIGTERDLEKAAQILSKIQNDKKYKNDIKYYLAKILLLSDDERKQNIAFTDLKVLADEYAHPEACFELYKIYRYGLIGQPINERNAIHYLRTAQKADLPLAKVAMADMFLKGLGTTENKSEAFTILSNVLEDDPDLIEANYMIGELYMLGEGTKRNDEKAYEHLKKAADADFADAKLMLALMISAQRVHDVDTKEALKIYKKLAEEGNIIATYEYGKALASGDGIDKDLKEACVYLKKAAENGNKNAMFLLGKTLNSLGENEEALVWLTKVAEDDEHPNTYEASAQLGEIYEEVDRRQSAIKAYKRAAEKGKLESAQVNLGRLYYEEKDYDMAKYWFEKNSMNAVAQTFLGLMYQKGKAFRQNDIKALEWYDKAIAQNNNDAMYLEAVLLREGKDVPDQSRDKAVGLLIRATCLGNEDAMLLLGSDRKYANSLGWLRYGQEFLGSVKAGNMLKNAHESQEYIQEQYDRVKDKCSGTRK